MQVQLLLGLQKITLLIEYGSLLISINFNSFRIVNFSTIQQGRYLLIEKLASSQIENKILTYLSLPYYQQMMQFRKPRKLQDQQPIHLEDLMQSVPKSYGQPSSVSNFTTTLKNTENKFRKKPLLTSIHQNIKETQMETEYNNNRSSRQLFHKRIVSQPNNIVTEESSSLQFKSQPTNKIKEHNRLQNNFVLREIVKKYKIKSIVSNFVKKLKRISISNVPTQINPAENDYRDFLWTKIAIELPQSIENIFIFLTIMQTVILCIIVSLCFVFDSVEESSFINYFQLYSFVLCLCQLILNLSTIKSSSGKKLKTLIDIWISYAKSNLVIDLLTLLIILLNCFILNKYILYLEAIVFLKIPQALDNIQKLQVFWIKNFYNEQYWSLIKIIISNFCFAHIISIFLVAMTSLDPDHNWMTQKKIWFSSWEEQYVWSYYWANTIMLTIGFGDISATNSKEALCLIFIETFSCLVFAYNINCIGSLIQHIRSQDAERSKKSKIFKKLTRQNHLNEDVSWKINNYIEENAQLRKRFNFQQQKQFITSLPQQLKKQYLKQSNKKIFQNIQFFKSFINKTLYNLAERIEIKVSHPDEVIQKIDDDYNLLILKAGQVGFFCKRPSFTLNDYVMDMKTVNQIDHPTLLNLDFIVKRRPYYQIRSIQYSIFYYLEYGKFIEALRQSEMDYEFYCSLRDKMKNIPDQFQIFTCDTCKGKHLKASCPRLHFIPYHETVIHRFLHRQKVSRNEKAAYNKRCDRKWSTFKVYNKIAMHIQKLKNLPKTKRRERYYLNTAYKYEASSSSRLKTMQQIKINHQIQKIRETYINSTYEVIKQQIHKLKKSDLQEDEVWILKLDLLYNFNAYFSKDNPSNIASKLQSKNEDKEISMTAIFQTIKSAFGDYDHFGELEQIPKIKTI